jgi:hypothetical protein
MMSASTREKLRTTTMTIRTRAKTLMRLKKRRAKTKLTTTTSEACCDDDAGDAT